MATTKLQSHITLSTVSVRITCRSLQTPQCRLIGETMDDSVTWRLQYTRCWTGLQWINRWIRMLLE